LREIVLDTETTGTDHATGDRIVEIGAVELMDYVPTGEFLHIYLNPERPMSTGAFEVHGLSDAFLADKKLFKAVADELHAFFGDARLVAHNAAFDHGFLNAEFSRSGHPLIAHDRVIDTLALARRRHPGASNSLDALCLRYGVDNARRTKHGALLDAELLAEVYIELIGGRQTSLGLAPAGRTVIALPGDIVIDRPRAPRPPRPALDPAAFAAHQAFVATLGEQAIWREYLGGGPFS
jgi:DNA polymerase-3 subunit epsilon